MQSMTVRQVHTAVRHGHHGSIAGSGSLCSPVANTAVAALWPHWGPQDQAATAGSLLGDQTPEAA